MTRVIDRGNSQAKSMYIGSAIDDAGLDPYEFRVYCHLKRRAQDGIVWERQDKMAEICKVSRKTVNEVLSRLEEKGWVEQRQRTLKGQQTSNLVYLLEPPCNPELHSRVTHGYTAVSPRVTAEGTPLEGTPLEGLKDGAEQRGAASLSESETSPSLEEPNTAQQGNPEKEAPTLETVPPAAAKSGKEIRAEWLAEYRAFERPEWLADKPWREWLDVRTAKRAEPKVGALTLMVRKLEAAQAQGYDPSEVLQIIADKGWTGFYDSALQDATPPTGALVKVGKGRGNARPQTMQEANQKFIQGMADTKEAIRGVFDD